MLTTPSVGNDEQYAAAMALMANRLRVPARVVVGAVLPASGVVKGKDVTAWVELRAADGTWQTLETDRFMAHRPPPATRGPGASEPERIFPEETPDDQSPEQRPNRSSPPSRRPSSPTTAQRPDAAEPDAGPPLWPWLALLLLLVAAAGRRTGPEVVASAATAQRRPGQRALRRRLARAGRPGPRPGPPGARRADPSGRGAACWSAAPTWPPRPT